jgi:Ni,Fe-hydrogenase I cytochrome b subunit
VGGFNLVQFDHKPVIFGVTYDRIIHYVIALVVEIDLLFQIFVTLTEGYIIHICGL